MDQWLVISLMIVAYLGLTLWVGLRAGRGTSSTVDGFVAGDRNFGFLVMYFVTGATVFSAFAFLGGPGWAYSRGAAAFYILSYGVLGMAPWYVIGPKVARIGRQQGQVTQAQFLTGRFRSRGLSLIIALISIAALIPYITLQMRGAGIVVEAVTDGRVPLWLRGKGYAVEVLSNSDDGRYRVRVGPVAARDRSEGLAKRLEDDEGLPTWILRVRES
ncbi:MAG: SPOR domain-containing protein [Pseudomonadota bacterium]